MNKYGKYKVFENYLEEQIQISKESVERAKGNMSENLVCFQIEYFALLKILNKWDEINSKDYRYNQNKEIK